MMVGPKLNPFEPPKSNQTSGRKVVNSFDQIGILSHCLVMATYMLVFVREDVPPRIALTQIPTWLHECAFFANTTAICLVVIPTILRRDWSWISKMFMLVFEAWIVTIVVYMSSGFGGMLSLTRME